MPPRSRGVLLSLSIVLLLYASFLSCWAAGFPRTVRDVQGREVTLDTVPRRIFSGGLNVGSTLLRLLPPHRVAAVSQFADDPSYSFVADTASTRPSYRQVRAETVLKFDPDLVILTRYTRADIRRKIRNLDIPVILTGTVNTKADIVRNTRLIGRAVGKTDAADSWIDHMDERLAQSTDRSGVVDVLYYTMSGTVPGKETLPDLILQSAGLKNNAAEAGIRGWKVMAPEQILDTPPDSFIFQDRNHEEVVEKLRNDPALNSLDAVRTGRFRSAEPKYLTVASPYIYRAVDYWRNQFRENRDAPS